MRVFLAIVVLVLLAPVLLLFAIALGPAALALAGLAGTAAVLAWVERAALGRGRDRHLPRYHG
jgi:hypothetical protein